MALDPLCGPPQQLSYKLLQCHRINDSLDVVVFCPQPPLAGIPQLLSEGERAADLPQCQQVEPWMVLFWNVTDSLQYGPFQVQVLQYAVSRQLVGHKLGLP